METITRKNRINYIFALALGLFAIFTIIYSGFIDFQLTAIIQGFLGLTLSVLFIVFERKFPFYINNIFFIITTFYAAGAILGHSFEFYLKISFYDKILHAFGGLYFAVIGYYLIQALNKKGNTNLLTKVIFAFIFSVAVSALWEIFEFSGDRLFNMDMQKDTYVSSVYSYLLSNNTRPIKAITDITELNINGTIVPGYLDIGIIDTMFDVISETVGALICSLVLFFDKERHPIFTKKNLSQPE